MGWNGGRNAIWTVAAPFANVDACSFVVIGLCWLAMCFCFFFFEGSSSMQLLSQLIRNGKQAMGTKMSGVEAQMMRVNAMRTALAKLLLMLMVGASCGRNNKRMAKNKNKNLLFFYAVCIPTNNPSRKIGIQKGAKIG